MRKDIHFPLRISGLGPGNHQLVFPIREDFMSRDEEALSLLNAGSCKGMLRVEVEKTPQVISLDVHIEASIGLCCDRTLQPFEHPLDIQKTFWIKFQADKKESYHLEENEDLFILSPYQDTLALDGCIFELIMLSLPMQRLHPSCVSKARLAEEESQQEELLYSTQDKEPPRLRMSFARREKKQTKEQTP